MQRGNKKINHCAEWRQQRERHMKSQPPALEQLILGNINDIGTSQNVYNYLSADTLFLAQTLIYPGGHWLTLALPAW